MGLRVEAGTQTAAAPVRRSRLSCAVPVCLLIGSLIIGTTAFYLNVTIPRGLEDPEKYRLLVSAKRFASDLASLQEVVFGWPYPTTLRRTIELVAFASPSEVEGSNIRAMKTAINGVTVRLYEPIKRNEQDGPGLIFIHGGGYFFGNPEMWDGLIRRIAEELDIVVVSVDYRLAPEHVYPAAFDDCFAVTKWFLKNAHVFRVDSTRVGISGDSAGGALAASVAQYIHDDYSVPDLKYQALIYPLTQLLDIETPAQQKYRRDFGESGGGITRWEAAALVAWYIVGYSDEEIILAIMKNDQTPSSIWRESVYAKFVNHSLVPNRFTAGETYSPLPVGREGNVNVWSQIGKKLLDPRLSPLMRLNMSGLPSAFVTTCEFDAMRDNGIYYAKRLAHDMVDVDWKHYDGGFHGVFGPTWPFTFKVGEQMFTDYIHFIKSHCYRLAPEHVHPAAFDDCFAVTKWFLKNAHAFRVDSTRIGISGDSAGGALAASVAQYIHDDYLLPDLKYQALIYPLTQLLDIETPAQQKYRRDFGESGGIIPWWEAAAIATWYLVGHSDKDIILAFMKNDQTPSNIWRESAYAKFINHSLVPARFTVGQNYSTLPVDREGNLKVWSQIGKKLLDPRLSPLMRLNMSGLPSAFVTTCEFDAMRDNGIYYAKRLAHDKVEVDWRHYEGGFHGVFGPTWPLTFKVGEQMFKDYIHFIKSHW